MSTLKKDLGLVDIYAIASGAMISSGLFILPGIAYAEGAGPGIIISYMLAALFASTGLLSQAELVTAMPKAGGTYFYIARSMGPAVGSVNGFLTWISLSFKSAFALYGLAYFVPLLLPDVAFSQFHIQLTALGFVLIFVIINIAGVKEAGRFQVIIVAFLIIILTVFSLYPIYSSLLPYTSEKASFNHFDFNFIKDFLNGEDSTHIFDILKTVGVVFVSFGGLLKVASVAEEVKNPAKTMPRGMILALVTVSILYILTIGVTIYALPPNELADNPRPISDAAGSLLGNVGLFAVSIAAVLSFVSTGNAGIMAASRYPLALSRDQLIPRFFGKVSKKRGTPVIAILFTGAIMVIAIFMNLEVLAKVASTTLMLTYMFSCLSVIIMRESKLQNYRPKFKSPGYPFIQIAGIVAGFIFLFQIKEESWLTSIILISLGLGVYWLYGRIRSNRESALLYIIRRAAASELSRTAIEDELKDIIRERDEIKKDRFDLLVEESTIIDIDGSLTLEAFFKEAAHIMSDIEEPDVLYEKLMKREQESTTVLNEFLAIPHIIIEGTGKFELFICRAKEGIVFSEEHQNIHTIFILAGSMDERNFHLRALASIAQIVQGNDFEKHWMHARGIEDIRDILLLGNRKR